MTHPTLAIIRRKIESARGLYHGEMALVLPALLRIAEAAEAAQIRLAMIGYPQTGGKYDKDGKWDFSKADPGRNPADLECIETAFAKLDAALASLPKPEELT